MKASESGLIDYEAQGRAEIERQAQLRAAHEARVRTPEQARKGWEGSVFAATQPPEPLLVGETVEATSLIEGKSFGELAAIEHAVAEEINAAKRKRLAPQIRTEADYIFTREERDLESLRKRVRGAMDAISKARIDEAVASGRLKLG